MGEKKQAGGIVMIQKLCYGWDMVAITNSKAQAEMFALRRGISHEDYYLQWCSPEFIRNNRHLVVTN